MEIGCRQGCVWWPLKTSVSRISWYQNVSVLDVAGVKDDGNGGDNWSYKTCKAPIKSSLPTNQHPAFYRLDAVPVPQTAVGALNGTGFAMMCCIHSWLLLILIMIPFIVHTFLSVSYLGDGMWTHSQSVYFGLRQCLQLIIISFRWPAATICLRPL